MHTVLLFILPYSSYRLPCADLFPEGVVIPVLRGILPDFDVVYAPLISSYGSCTGAVIDTGACLTLEEALLHAWWQQHNRSGGRKAEGLLLAIWLLTGLAGQSLAPDPFVAILGLLQMLHIIAGLDLHAEAQTVPQAPLGVPTCMLPSHRLSALVYTGLHRIPRASAEALPACCTATLNPSSSISHSHRAPADSLQVCCAATLEHSPGTNVALFVTYLTPPLLERMHATEGAYNLCELHEVQLHLGLGLEDFG